MHTRFFLINRSQHAMQKRFFQCERFVSATHVVSFHIRNIPYAPGTAISFGRGLENPVGLRFVFGRGLENRMGIRLRFVRGLENPSNFWFVFIRRIKNQIGIRFIRPLTWPFVGRMQYAPTRTDENRAGFWFVFIRGRGKWPGIAWIDIPGRAFGVVRL